MLLESKRSCLGEGAIKLTQASLKNIFGRGWCVRNVFFYGGCAQPASRARSIVIATLHQGEASGNGSTQVTTLLLSTVRSEKAPMTGVMFFRPVRKVVVRERGAT